MNNAKFAATNGWAPFGKREEPFTWLNFRLGRVVDEGDNKPPTDPKEIETYKLTLIRLVMAWYVEWLLEYATAGGLKVLNAELISPMVHYFQLDDPDTKAESNLEKQFMNLIEAKKKEENGSIPPIIKFADSVLDRGLLCTGIPHSYCLDTMLLDRWTVSQLRRIIEGLIQEVWKPIEDWTNNFLSAQAATSNLVELLEFITSGETRAIYACLVGQISVPGGHFTMFPALGSPEEQEKVTNGQLLKVLRQTAEKNQILELIFKEMGQDVGERLRAFFWPVHEPEYHLVGYGK